MQRFFVARKYGQSPEDWMAIVEKIESLKGIQIVARGRSQIEVETTVDGGTVLTEKFGTLCHVELPVAFEPAS